MINFFRKIRQSTVRESKISKYLLYAFGEILLVVIGILIALEIDDWNQRQNTNLNVQKLLSSLSVDLENDLKAIDQTITLQTERLEIISTLISAGPNYKSDSLEYIGVGRNRTFFPVVGSYKSASSSGLIDEIKDEALKKSILNLYEYLYNRLGYNGEINDRRHEMVEWESRQYTDFSKRSLSFNKKALLDRNFLNQLGYSYRFINVYLELVIITKKSIEQTLLSIKVYEKKHFGK